MGLPSMIRKMKRKSSKHSGVYQTSLHPQDFQKSATFINVTIRDASEVVYDKVHSALRHINLAPKILPKFKGHVANKIATEASKRVPPSQIANVLAIRLPKLLMYQMYHKHGMTISAQTVFVENSFIVVQLQVLRVDANKLFATQAATKEGEEVMDNIDMKVVDAWMEEQQQQLIDATSDTATVVNIADDSSSSSSNNWLQSALGFLPDSTKTRLEGQTLPQVVQTKLTERMQGLLVAQLASKQLCGEIAVLPEEEQARFFFAYLQQVRKRREDEQQKKKKGVQRK